MSCSPKADGVTSQFPRKIAKCHWIVSRMLQSQIWDFSLEEFWFTSGINVLYSSESQLFHLSPLVNTAFGVGNISSFSTLFLTSLLIYTSMLSMLFFWIKGASHKYSDNVSFWGPESKLSCNEWVMHCYILSGLSLNRLIYLLRKGAPCVSLILWLSVSCHLELNEKQQGWFSVWLNVSQGFERFFFISSAVNLDNRTSFMVRGIDLFS